jgi:RNA recognition motif-containing protein
MNGLLPQLVTKPGTSSDDTMGFSHGAFKLNSHNSAGGSLGHRHPRRTNVPAINTAAGRDNPNDIATPGTALDMQFTPLLPSQLLLGSPFQSGSPAAFASPRFSNFAVFHQASSVPNQQNGRHVNGAGDNASLQHHGSPPPPPINTLLPTAGFAPQMLSPQSPSAHFPSAAASGLGYPTTAMMGSLVPGTSRTVYLGNIPSETSAEEILNHVRSGQIESVRLLNDKNCAFISFLDSSSATHFHSDAILKKLSIRGHDIKVGWGKPSHVPTSVALAVQQSAASRNVYLGGLPDTVTEQELRDDLAKFGTIDTVKLVKEKSIGFVHFLSIANAMKAVSHLPQEPKWQSPRRVSYGKDRCAYVSKTQQQNAAQYLGIAPGLVHMLNAADRDVISNAIAQQSVAAAAVASSAGGLSNVGNRTVYLGNIHPETTTEEICNVVRGGLLHHIRYIPDKHICFVTFIDPTSAASFYALSQIQGLMIHNRRLKIGWGKHSGALPPAIALAVSGGASRNVYVGNLDESWTEDRLKQDFTEYGEIELVNTLREKSCAFVNFTNIANAIKAIEGIRGREEYRRFKINFGKDRCGNPPRQNAGAQKQQQQHQHQQAMGSPNGIHEGVTPPQTAAGGLRPPPSRTGSANSPTRGEPSPAPGSAGATSGRHSPQTTVLSPPPALISAPEANPLTMYLSQLSIQQAQHVNGAHSIAALQPHQPQMVGAAQMMPAAYGVSHEYIESNGASKTPTSAWTMGGLLAPSNSARGQHARAISLPLFSQEQAPPATSARAHANPSSLASGGFGGGGSGNSYSINAPGLPGWSEEEVAAQ